MRRANPKLAAKLYPNRSGEEQRKIDTVKDGDFNRNDNVMLDAFAAWSGLDSFRNMAERNKVYTFVDQWSDKVKTKCGWITERQNILNQGNVPLQNNRIRGIVRSVSGVFQSQQTEPVCVSRDRDEQSKGEMMSATIQYVYQLNKLWGLDSSAFTDFLVTGLGAFKSIYGWRNGKMDVWVDKVNHNRIFFDNHMIDPRHWDCHLIGEIHDVGLYDVMSQFAEGSQAKAERIRNIYSGCDKTRTMTYAENITRNRRDLLNFFIPIDETRCRVIEVWKKESKERLLVHDRLTGEYYKAEIGEETALAAENQRRIEEQTVAGVSPENMKLIAYEWFIDNYWYFYYLSPYGDVLKEGESPFWHESHPYSFKVYPFFDGQVFPFVSDFIDQQRYINRLITMQDFVTRSSAKGVLAIDEKSLPEGWNIDDYTEAWAAYNGAILYNSKQGAKLPQQIVTNSTQLGLTDMLQIQLKLLEDISGVQGALQGQAPAAGTPASLYLQQTQNSTTSLTELYESFRELREERDMKNMKLIQQFYTDIRYININGSNARPETMIYDPAVVRNAEMDLTITESTSTPAYRLVMNDFLMQLFAAQQISLEELLKNGAFPFADKLLQSIQARNDESQAAQAAIMQGQQPNQSMQQDIVPPEVQQQLQQQTSPIVQQMMSNNQYV